MHINTNWHNDLSQVNTMSETNMQGK